MYFSLSGYYLSCERFSLTSPGVDYILLLICVYVASIYAYRNCFCENVLNIYAFRNFSLPQKDNDNICFNNVNCVHLNEVQMHILILIMGDAGIFL